MIPPVETTTPLAVDETAPVTAPAETTEEAPVNGEKKEVKSEKRKSSLPFAFGSKKDKSVETEGEKHEKTSPFSKLRATIKVSN